MYNDVNINMLGCSNYTQASEKLAANFIANTNDSANSPCHKNFIDLYQRYILNDYDQIVLSADEEQMLFINYT